MLKLFKNKKNKHRNERGFQELARLIKESSEKHESFDYIPCVVGNLRERANIDYFRSSKLDR